MTSPTINKINAAIAKHEIELVKGEGYFYFIGTTDAGMNLSNHIQSVFTSTLKDISLEEWIEYAELEVEQASA